jgi:uncharacterized Ntn-hydrolase superfamily protein
MVSERIWPEMLDAYTATAGSLTDRLLAALDAAEAAGGDLRGRQSAAILVVPATGEPWETVVSLRVEDHPNPLAELRRLVSLSDADALAGQADELVNEGRHDEAAALYGRADRLAPDQAELRFWTALETAHAGDLDAAIRTLRELEPNWLELLGRLPAELAPAAPAVLARLRPGS